jgi:hypothetical protein
MVVWGWDEVEFMGSRANFNGVALAAAAENGDGDDDQQFQDQQEKRSKQLVADAGESD